MNIKQEYEYKPYQKAYEDGYNAGMNEWRYNAPDFRTDAQANEAYNKGWKKGVKNKLTVDYQ